VIKLDCSAHFSIREAHHLGFEVPILGMAGVPAYAWQGSIFVAGAANVGLHLNSFYTFVSIILLNPISFACHSRQ
jgi:hypothetical protein